MPFIVETKLSVATAYSALVASFSILLPYLGYLCIILALITLFGLLLLHFLDVIDFSWLLYWLLLPYFDDPPGRILQQYGFNDFYLIMEHGFHQRLICGNYLFMLPTYIVEFDILTSFSHGFLLPHRCL